MAHRSVGDCFHVYCAGGRKRGRGHGSSGSGRLKCTVGPRGGVVGKEVGRDGGVNIQNVVGW